jgi:hypothetical protein
MEKPKTLSEIEAILKVSGIGAWMPKEIKDAVCHGVAVDIVAYYEPLIQQVAREVFEEIEKHRGEFLWIPVAADWDKNFTVLKEAPWYQLVKSKYGGQNV